MDEEKTLSQEIEDKLREAVKNGNFEDLQNLQDAYATVKKMELEKAKNDISERTAIRSAELEEKRDLARKSDAKKDRLWNGFLKIGEVGVTVGLFFVGLNFEKTGTICSTFVKKIITKR